MTEREFREALARGGYDEVRTVEYEPGMDGELHTHEFSAMAFVLDGELTLAFEDGPATFAAGQWCEVPAGTVHAERTTDVGARILVGTRQPD